MKKFLMSVLFLSACTFQYMDEGLSSLNGQPIQIAITVLGYPDGQVTVGDTVVYIWNNSESYTYDVPYSEITNYTVSSMELGTAFLSGISRGFQTQTIEGSCRIKIAVNSYGYIIHTEYKGSALGCERYADRLYKYLYPRRGGAIF